RPRQVTCPDRSARGSVLLTPQVLVRHFSARETRDVLGLHTTSTENTSLWGAIDVDAHGPGGNDPEANLAAALAWYDRLRGLGLRPPVSNRKAPGGVHRLATCRET